MRIPSNHCPRTLRRYKCVLMWCSACNRTLPGGLPSGRLRPASSATRSAMTQHPRYLVRRIKTITATSLVPFLTVTSLPACATLAHRSSAPAEFQSTSWALSGEWSRVEAVRVGTPVRVQLHEIDPHRRSRTIHGRFCAATADTLTLTLDEWSSSTHTIAKSAVRTVHVRRPVGQRYAGWLSWLGTTLVLAVQDPGDWDTSFHLLVSTAIGAAASLPGFLVQRMQRIY